MKDRETGSLGGSVDAIKMGEVRIGAVDATSSALHVGNRSAKTSKDTKANDSPGGGGGGREGGGPLSCNSLMARCRGDRRGGKGGGGERLEEGEGRRLRFPMARCGDKGR